MEIRDSVSSKHIAKIIIVLIIFIFLLLASIYAYQNLITKIRISNTIEDLFVSNFKNNWDTELFRFHEGSDLVDISKNYPHLCGQWVWNNCNFCNIPIVSRQDAEYHLTVCNEIMCEYCEKKIDVHLYKKHIMVHETINRWDHTFRCIDFDFLDSLLNAEVIINEGDTYLKLIHDLCDLNENHQLSN